MRTLTLLLSSLVVTAPLAAQGWIEPLPGRPDMGVVKERTAVTVRVSGRVAQIEVEEWFRNTGRGLGEGDYLYPLPGEAVFSNFSLFQGDQELRGETMDAQEARRIYEEIVRRKKDPALIELVGHGLVRSRVFPINPGDTRKITLRYTQVLDRAGDALQLRYAAGGRNVIQRRPVRGDETGPTRVIDSAPLTFELVVHDGERFRDPFSPTHEVRVTRSGDRIRVRPTSDLSGDFTVLLPFAEPFVGVSVITHRTSGEDGYFMLTLSPGDARGDALPRDLTVVLDVSGSMSGSKLEQARAALDQLLSSLASRDRFRLLSFSNGVSAHRPDWASVSATSLRDARAWVDGLRADGGTNIAGALEEAFRLSSPDARLPIVVFITDGLPSVGERDPERIAAQAEGRRGRSRVFAFGVGHDVNTYLLDRLSAAGRGATEYVEPGEDVEDALGTLAAKIQHPVLVDVAIADAPVELHEVYPRTLPDLFVGEELVVFGRYRPRGDRSGELSVTGRRNDRTERYATEAAFPQHVAGNDFIPRLWASRKIGELTRSLRLEGPNPRIVEEIRTTALRYGLLSEYTSYLVQDPEVVARGARMDRTTIAAPAQASGTVAVRAAEQSRARREAKSMADIAIADEALLNRAHGPSAEHEAGRLFVLKEGVWTDLMHGDSLRVVSVAPYSSAYFALLERAPELKPYVARFEHVLVAGRRVSIRIAEGGSATMSAADLARLVEQFRKR
jgi:Ca-activated chloride channel family protein